MGAAGAAAGPLNGIELAGWHEAGHVAALLHAGATVEYAAVTVDGGEVQVQWSGAPPATAARVAVLAGPTAESWARNPRHGLPPWTRWSDEWAHDLADWQRRAGMRLAATDVANPADPVRARWRADLDEAHRIVRGNRMLMVAVAAELVAHRRLTGDEIARIAGRERQRIDVARSAGLAVAT